MRILKISALLLFLCVTLVECKKYEEGPRISFRSKEKRLFKYWEVKSVEVDGSDKSTEYFDSTYAYRYCRIQRNSVGDLEAYCHGNEEYGQRFFFSIEDDFETIRMNSVLTGQPSSNPSYVGFQYGPIGLSSVDWTILKLKKDHLKLKASYSGVVYIWEFGPLS